MKQYKQDQYKTGGLNKSVVIWAFIALILAVVAFYFALDNRKNKEQTVRLQSDYTEYAKTTTAQIEALNQRFFELTPNGTMNRYAIYDMISGNILYVVTDKVLPATPELKVLSDSELAAILHQRFLQGQKQINELIQKEQTNDTTVNQPN